MIVAWPIPIEYSAHFQDTNYLPSRILYQRELKGSWILSHHDSFLCNPILLVHSDAFDNGLSPKKEYTPEYAY